MTAHEAREITLESLKRQYERINKPLLSIIFDEIRSAAEKGLTRVNSSVVFSDDMVVYLENMGYTVPTYTTIGGWVADRSVIEWT